MLEVRREIDGVRIHRYVSFHGWGPFVVIVVATNLQEITQLRRFRSEEAARQDAAERLKGNRERRYVGLLG